MNFVRLGLVALGMFGVMVAGSAGATNRSHTSMIKTIYALDNGSAILSFDAESTDCTNSANPKYYVISVGQAGATAEGLKQMYATALMAYSTKKAHHLYVRRCHDELLCEADHSGRLIWN